MSCPNCGYCPSCGRSNCQPYRGQPWYPYPWYGITINGVPQQPPIQTWTGDTLPNPEMYEFATINGGGRWQ